jgi:hypothetical protein
MRSAMVELGPIIDPRLTIRARTRCAAVDLPTRGLGDTVCSLPLWTKRSSRPNPKHASRFAFAFDDGSTLWVALDASSFAGAGARAAGHRALPAGGGVTLGHAQDDQATFELGRRFAVAFAGGCGRRHAPGRRARGSSSASVVVTSGATRPFVGTQSSAPVSGRRRSYARLAVVEVDRLPLDGRATSSEA